MQQLQRIPDERIKAEEAEKSNFQRIAVKSRPSSAAAPGELDCRCLTTVDAGVLQEEPHGTEPDSQDDERNPACLIEMFISDPEEEDLDGCLDAD